MAETEKEIFERITKELSDQLHEHHVKWARLNAVLVEHPEYRDSASSGQPVDHPEIVRRILERLSPTETEPGRPKGPKLPAKPPRLVPRVRTPVDRDTSPEVPASIVTGFETEEADGKPVG